MKRFSLLFTLFSTSLLIASPSVDDKTAAKGGEVSAALLQKLGGEVKAKMQSDGPVGTLRFCSQNALVLTDTVAQETGTSIKRVSLKNRNPVNAAEKEEQSLLKKWGKIVQNGQSLPDYELKKISKNQSVYYKPILINNEACLKCHGEIQADTPLGKAIAATYPEDKATGYKMGDLRGMIAITITE